MDASKEHSKRFQGAFWMRTKSILNALKKHNECFQTAFWMLPRAFWMLPRSILNDFKKFSECFQEAFWMLARSILNVFKEHSKCFKKQSDCFQDAFRMNASKKHSRCFEVASQMLLGSILSAIKGVLWTLSRSILNVRIRSILKTSNGNASKGHSGFQEVLYLISMLISDTVTRPCLMYHSIPMLSWVTKGVLCNRCHTRESLTAPPSKIASNW